jgi:chemotaxis protein methyltransferase CheR
VPRDASARMTDEEFRLIRDHINAVLGISFDEDARFLVERRLAPRLQALALGDFTAYYRHLRFAPDPRAELDELAERVTTNETYFFREQYQLDALQQEILPELARLRPRGRRLAIWSAGCSTGEEAYTAAILVLESALFADWEVRVFGNDVSRRVIALARKGVYGRASFRQTDEQKLRRWFRPAPAEGDGKHQVRDEVKSLVTFAQLNLLDRAALALVGEVDVILCRNVLMYFDAASRRRVIDALHQKLARGGYLLLGHTESLLNLSTAFELIHLRHDMVYRKP